MESWNLEQSPSPRCRSQSQVPAPFPGVPAPPRGSRSSTNTHPKQSHGSEGLRAPLTPPGCGAGFVPPVSGEGKSSLEQPWAGTKTSVSIDPSRAGPAWARGWVWGYFWCPQLSRGRFGTFFPFPAGTERARVGVSSAGRGWEPWDGGRCVPRALPGELWGWGRG